MKTIPHHRLRFIATRQCSRSFTTANASSADRARIVEVGPRDGLQNEKSTISFDTKLELIRRLAKTGVTHMEAGSFVPSKWVPQMASTAEIFESIITGAPAAPHPVAYNFLVPNLRGMQNFVEVSQRSSRSTPSPDQGGAAPITSASEPNEMFSASPITTEISLFAAATEAFSKVNTNCTIAESLDRSRPITALAKENGIRVRGYVSVALGCPYEGPDVDPHKVAELTASLLELGCDEVSVADTTGMGTAPRTRNLLKTLTAAGIRNEDIALHFHDTYGQALVNTVVGLEHGIRIFDSSVAGLGGCPYSKGATGNVATEDLVHTLHSLGLQTGIDLEQMAEIGNWISTELNKKNDSRAGKATLARLRG